jgi:hypothetical protein
MYRSVFGLVACFVAVSMFATRCLAAEPRDKPAFTYKLTKKGWKIGDKPVYLCDQKQGFGILSGFSGEFAGNGEFLQVRTDEKQKWYLHGQGFTGAVAGNALVIQNLSPRLFATEHKVYEWLAGGEPVKMIPSDEGVCYISLIKGAFSGGGERVWIEERDGFYWLHGMSQQAELGAQATALTWKRGQQKGLTTSTHRWKTGDEPVEIFPKTSGLCFVSAIGGNLAGYGEELSLDVNEKGVWILSGRSQQESLQIEAIGLRWDGK